MQVAAVQEEFRRTEGTLKMAFASSTDPDGVGQVRWLPTPEEGTKQKLESVQRFLALAKDQTPDVPIAFWGQLPHAFAQLTVADLAQPVTRAELRAELLASGSDIV